MTSIRIYEAALCCDTGVCGVDVDEALVTITADVRRLTELGADISRHNLAGDPLAFTSDEAVRGFMQTVGSAGLPLTVVDGVTVAAGSYPTRDFLLRVAGLAPEFPAAPEGRRELGLAAAPTAAGGCCGGSGCC